MTYLLTLKRVSRIRLKWAVKWFKWFKYTNNIIIAYTQPPKTGNGKSPPRYGIRLYIVIAIQLKLKTSIYNAP